MSLLGLMGKASNPRQVRDLAVAENVTVGGTLAAVGAISGASVTVTGALAGATLSTSGNATVGGTLAVTGNATVAGLTASSMILNGNVAHTGIYALIASGNNVIRASHASGALQFQTGGTSERMTIASDGAVTMTGSLAVTGAATAASITVTGALAGATLSTSGNATVGGTLGVTGNFAVNTNKFNVTAASGNTTIAGTLGVTGAATLTSTLAVNGTTMTLGTGTGEACTLFISSAAAKNRVLAFRTGSTARWQFVVDSGAESGSNAGSDLTLRCYSDAGALIASPLSFVRATGALALSGAVTCQSTLGVTGAATFSSTVTAQNNITCTKSSSPIIESVETGGASTTSMQMWDEGAGIVNLRGSNSSGSCTMRLGCNVADGSSAADIAFFRTTNTSGARTFTIFKGNNTATATLTFNADTGALNTGSLTLSGALSCAALTASGVVILSQSATPASAGAAGTAGQRAWDADYIYQCVAANTWKRAAIATW